MKPLFIRPDEPDDFSNFKEIFVDRILEPAARVKDVKTIIDVGAYIGYTTYFLWQHYPDAKFICLEPNSPSFDMLCANTTMIDRDKIVLLPWALWDKTVRLSLVPNHLPMGTRVVAGNGDVSAIDMNILIEAREIEIVDILKIDIEDAERIVFAGDTKWIDKVRNIIMEIHSAESEKIVFDAMKKYRCGGSKRGNMFWFRNITKV